MLLLCQGFQAEWLALAAESSAIFNVVPEVLHAAGRPLVAVVARAVAQFVIHVAKALRPVHLSGFAHSAGAPGSTLGRLVGALPLSALVVVAHSEVVPNLVGNGLEFNSVVSGFFVLYTLGTGRRGACQKSLFCIISF